MFDNMGFGPIDSNISETQNSDSSNTTSTVEKESFPTTNVIEMPKETSEDIKEDKKNKGKNKKEKEPKPVKEKPVKEPKVKKEKAPKEPKPEKVKPEKTKPVKETKPIPPPKQTNPFVAALIIIVGIVVMLLLSLVMADLITYYDFAAVMAFGIPTFVIIRLFDLYIYNLIAKKRRNQILVATFLTTIIMLAIFGITYFIYTNVLGSYDFVQKFFIFLTSHFRLPFLNNFI